ncbi:hypothetical protein E3O45_15140 [Cryobacterium sp. TMS1-20-1]|uniref:hypothetical protein n=1 Tax=Cryobacterium sp. TMS1-20-1 TaxID=1259223 RepID=UPI00106B8F1D|nr:hypothetical protein [Cryobacterium sp. TMS1-20-1]TFC71406.1 hypothetical protein E3O45_15140 [Cryobacterium sp. TMS1-20-1]
MTGGESGALQGAPLSTTAAALIGATIETRLAVVLEQLQTDTIALDDLTPALQGFVLHGHGLALASTLPEMTRAEIDRDQARADADRYYQLLFNPRKPLKIGPSYVDIQKTRHELYSGGAR